MCKKLGVKLKVDFDPKLFDNAMLGDKAEYVMSIKQAEQDLKDAIAQVKTIFEQDLADQRGSDITKALQITTEYGVVELPAGYAEKTLKVGEVEAFSKALQKLDTDAFDQVISMTPKVNKVAVNNLRKEIGPIKDLIDKTYDTKENRSAVYNLSKTI
jgi:hypothetical protein